MRKLRKLTALGMAAGMAVSMAGCGGQASQPPESAAAPTTAGETSAAAGEAPENNIAVEVDSFNWKQFEGEEIVLLLIWEPRRIIWNPCCRSFMP